MGGDHAAGDGPADLPGPPGEPSEDERELQALQRDLARRKNPPGPRKLAAAVNDLLARRGYARVQTASAFDAAWRQAVGERLAAHSRPANLQAGALEIIARNSAVLQELTFQKKTLLRKLAEALPGQVIKNLKFRVGEIT